MTFALLVTSIMILPAVAQQAESASPQATPTQSSFRLESVSFYTGYYSSGFDFTATTPSTAGASLGADVGVGGAATIGWQRPRDRSDVFMTYTADYSGHLRYSAWQALNHHLSFNANRRWSRWDFRFSAAASVSTTDQLLFAPTALSTVAATPATFADLTTGIMGGTSQNRALAPVLTGVQAVVSPALLLYGSRTLSASAQFSATTRLSDRTSIQISAGGTRNQGLPVSNSIAQAGAPTLAIRATSGNLGLSISHLLTPRTQVSVALLSTRAFSGLADAYYNSFSLAITRTLSERWFATVHGGGGDVLPVRQTNIPLSGPQYLAGGSLGFKTFAHTLLGSYDRNFSDTYGLGASISSSTTGAWSWRRPDSTWRVQVSAGQQQLQTSAFPTLDTWQASFSLQKALSSHAVIAAQYAYMRYSGGPAAATNAISPSAVRLTFSWAPGLGLLP